MRMASLTVRIGAMFSLLLSSRTSRGSGSDWQPPKRVEGGRPSSSDESESWPVDFRCLRGPRDVRRSAALLRVEVEGEDLAPFVFPEEIA